MRGGGELQCREILLVQQAAVWREHLLYGLSEEGLKVPGKGGVPALVCRIFRLWFSERGWYTFINIYICIQEKIRELRQVISL